MTAELVFVPREERERRHISYEMWIFNWRFRQALPALERAFQSIGRAVKSAMRAITHIGYDYQRNLRYVGGHWYPVEHMPMTARQYRAWKRMQGRRG